MSTRVSTAVERLVDTAPDAGFGLWISASAKKVVRRVGQEASSILSPTRRLGGLVFPELR
jgi:hypothetical protein